MWKKYKTTLILTTLISLFPTVIGLLLWNRMPDTIATHFGTNNVPNGWSSKTMAVIGIPLFLAALQIFTAVFTFSDPKRQNIGPKMIRLVLWIIPVTSLIVCCSIYANAVGITVDIGFVANGIVGLLFILIGITCQNANRTTQPASRFHGPFTVRKTGTALTASPAGFGSSAALP